METYCCRVAFLLFISVNLHAQSDTPKANQESLDVNQINSSVDVGSFYSIEASVKQIEENIIKMAQDLKKLKQQLEFAKEVERKHLDQIQKLEKSRINSFDNSLTVSTTKLETNDPSSADACPKACQEVAVEVVLSPFSEN